MKRGPYKGQLAAFTRARVLRAEGLGYRSIAAEVGVPWMTVKGWVVDIAIDTQSAHLRAMAARRQDLDNLSSKSGIRDFLLRTRGRVCSWCSLSEWRGMPIILEVDHVDGNTNNNHADNLRILCPNCHSQTPTWKRKKSKLL